MKLKADNTHHWGKDHYCMTDLLFNKNWFDRKKENMLLFVFNWFRTCKTEEQYIVIFSLKVSALCSRLYHSLKLRCVIACVLKLKACKRLCDTNQEKMRFRAWRSLAEGDGGTCIFPNCQTSLVIVLHELSVLFAISEDELEYLKLFAFSSFHQALSIG